MLYIIYFVPWIFVEMWVEWNCWWITTRVWKQKLMPGKITSLPAFPLERSYCHAIITLPVKSRRNLCPWQISAIHCCTAGRSAGRTCSSVRSYKSAWYEVLSFCCLVFCLRSGCHKKVHSMVHRGVCLLPFCLLHKCMMFNAWIIVWVSFNIEFTSILYFDNN